MREGETESGKIKKRNGNERKKSVCLKNKPGRKGYKCGCEITELK